MNKKLTCLGIPLLCSNCRQGEIEIVEDGFQCPTCLSFDRSLLGKLDYLEKEKKYD